MVTTHGRMFGVRLENQLIFFRLARFFPLCALSVSAFGSLMPNCYPKGSEGSAFVGPSSSFHPKLSIFDSLSFKSPHQYHSMELTLPLFSYCYAPFCDGQSLKVFPFKSLCTLYSKHPGGGTPPRFVIASSARKLLFLLRLVTSLPLYFATPHFTSHGPPATAHV